MNNPHIKRPTNENGQSFEQLVQQLVSTTNPVTYTSIANILQERLQHSIKSGVLK